MSALHKEHVRTLTVEDHDGKQNNTIEQAQVRRNKKDDILKKRTPPTVTTPSGNTKPVTIGHGNQHNNTKINKAIRYNKPGEKAPKC